MLSLNVVRWRQKFLYKKQNLSIIISQTWKLKKKFFFFFQNFEPWTLVTGISYSTLYATENTIILIHNCQGWSKIFFIYFQKLHGMARKFNEKFFGPPLHPQNWHFLSKILNFGGHFRHLWGVIWKKERRTFHKVVINYQKMQKYFFFFFKICGDYTRNHDSRILYRPLTR